MTRLTVHPLGDDRLLVCTDMGRRFELAAAASSIHDPAVDDALHELRAAYQPDDPAPSSEGMLTIDGLDALPRHAQAVTDTTTVQWTFAGHVYRVRLEAGTAAATAAEVVHCLLSTIADPAHASILARRALVDDLADAGADSESRESAARMEAGVLKRWEQGSWHEHRLEPPPLVDPVSGILRRIVERPHQPQAPQGFVHVHAELPHLASVDPTFQPDPLAPAGSFRGAPLTATDEGILSGVAHLCGAYLGQGTRRTAAADALRRDGHRMLAVSEWRPHDRRLHDVPGFPFMREDPSRPTWWLEGEDDDGSCWVPLSLVHAGYLSAGLDGLTATNSHNLVGLQAGFTKAEASDRAAAHLIAQDAITRWWDHGGPLSAVELPRVVAAGWGECPWRARVLAVPTCFDVPVRLAVIDDSAENIIALGYGCATTGDEAGIRAVGEALIQHASARDLNRTDSLIRSAQDLDNGGIAGLAAHDPDRRYRDAFANRRLLIDPMCHLQYGLDPNVVEDTRRRTQPRDRVQQDGQAHASPYEALRKAARVIRVDVTTDRVRRAGATAIRLLAPTLDRLTVAAFDCDTHAAPYPGW